MSLKDSRDKILGLAILGLWTASAALSGDVSAVAEPLAAVGIGALAIGRHFSDAGKGSLGREIKRAFEKAEDRYRRTTSESGYSADDINCAFQTFEKHFASTLPSAADLARCGTVAERVAALVVDRLVARAGDAKPPEQFASNDNAQRIIRSAFVDAYAVLADTPEHFARVEPAVARQMLTELESLYAEVASIGATVGRIANPQPILDLPELPDTEATRFVYSARHALFAGRDREMQELQAFADDPRRFAWRLIHGSGGVGKSRLAFEFMRGMGSAFHTGFLSRNAAKDFNWWRWQPERPVFLTIDYAATDPDLVANINEALSARSADSHPEPLHHPVRMLLLERTDEGPWLDTITGSGRSTRHAIESARFAGRDVLTTVADVWRIIQSYFESAGKPLPDRTETLNLLHGIDPEQRPLYAAFLADALLRGQNPRGWDRLRLVKDVLDYERVHYWDPAGVDEASKRLAALITMVDGLPYERCRELCAEHASTGLLPAWHFDRTPRQLQAILGEVERSFPSLQPDILGEVFVLETLRANPLAVAELREIAWQFPTAAMAFLDRLALDFPEYLMENIFDAPHSLNELGRLWRARLLVNLTIWLRNNEFFVDKICTEIETLYSAHSGEPALRVCWAESIVHRIEPLGKKDLKAACDLYSKLVELAMAFPQEIELRVRQASGVVNLIDTFANEDIKGACDLYGELVELAMAFPQEPRIRHEQAGAAVNLIYVLGNNDIEAAHRIYVGVVDLAKDHDDEPGIKLEQAKAALNLIVHLGTWDMAAARARYGELAALAADNAGEPEIGLQQAKAAFILIAHLGTTDIAVARALYGELAALAAHHARKPEIRLEQAKAAFDLIQCLRTTDIAAARALYGELAALAAHHASEPEIRLEQARAAVNLIGHLGATDIAATRALYGELAALAAHHASEPEIRLEQAKAGVNLIYHLPATDIAAARTLYGELAALAAHNASEPELRLRQAQAAFNLIGHLGATDIAAARTLYGELTALAALDAGESKSVFCQVRAAVNLMHFLGTSDIAEARALCSDVQAAAVRWRSREFDEAAIGAGLHVIRLLAQSGTGEEKMRSFTSGIHEALPHVAREILRRAGIDPEAGAGEG